MIIKKSDVLFHIEFKYLKKIEFNDKILKEKIEEAKNQLDIYIKDSRVTKSERIIKAIAGIYSSYEMVYCE